MSDGFFDIVIKICTVSSFILFSLFGMAFAFLSIFKIFTEFLNKILITSTVNIDCNNNKYNEGKLSKKLKRDKNNKSSKTKVSRECVSKT